MLSTMLAIAAAGSVPAKVDAVSEMARLTSGPCYDMARSAVATPSPGDLAGLDALVTSFGITPGIAGNTFERLGPAGGSLVSRATMGSKDLGEESLVMAFGGQAPGCSVALLTGSGQSREYEIVAALVAAGWKEPNPGVSQQRGVIGKRMLVKRDEAGRPYLVNVLTIMQPNSDFRHVTTLVAIPQHVKLPAGV